MEIKQDLLILLFCGMIPCVALAPARASEPRDEADQPQKTKPVSAKRGKGQVEHIQSQSDDDSGDHDEQGEESSASSGRKKPVDSRRLHKAYDGLEVDTD